MFENRKDTVLFHGALLSAANTNSGSLCNCSSLENAVQIVSDSVKKITSLHLDGVKEDKENIKAQLLCNRRLHAAIFFTTLRSHGITSSSADSFYSSIADVWPAIDFKFYVELNFRSEWSEYFFESASQLPCQTLQKVLNLILNTSLSKDIQSYSWYLVLQACIWKLLDVPLENEIHILFKFDFAENANLINESLNCEMAENTESVNDAEAKFEMSEDEICILKDIFNSVFNHICGDINDSGDSDSVKILLHAIKTLLKNIPIERDRGYKNISNYVDFLQVYTFLNKRLESNSCQELLKLASSSCVGSVVKHTYATTSWNISGSYLCFLVSYYWNQIYSDFYFKMELPTRNALVYSEMISNTLLYDTLDMLNPLLRFEKNEELNFLQNIVHLNFEGALFVAEMFLSKPAILEKQNTMKILEENCYVVDFVKMYPHILRCVKAVKSQDLKLRLLKLFYKLLPTGDLKIYNDILKTILNEHGFTEEFQLPDFPDQFSQCFRTTPTTKEVEEKFPVLFLQSPLRLLKHVVDQVLIQGPDGKTYLEPLKYVQFSCIYQENKDAMPALIGILDSYFVKDKLEPWESKNMATLYKLLMKIQANWTHIIVLDVFFNRCIIPKLQHDNDKIELILECVKESLAVLIQNKSFFIGSDTLMSFIVCLGKLVNDCIETQNGRLKANVICVIKALIDHLQTSGSLTDADKMKLWASFQSLNEIVFVYMREFLPGDIEFSSKPSIWTYCCKTKDSSLFTEQLDSWNLTYPILLQILQEVLPHLTKEEWLYSANLVKICCKNSALREEMLFHKTEPFPLTNKELEIYAIVSCFITSLHFILENNRDSVYIVSSFANCLMAILNQGENESMLTNTRLLLTILLDCCHLVECISPDMGRLLTLFLLDLKKHIISSCVEENHKKDCKILISSAVKCLPTSCDKTVLLSF